MNAKLIFYGTVLVIFLVLVLAFSTNFPSAGVRAAEVPVQNAEISTVQPPTYLGGDCSADRATGDLYIPPDYFYCLSPQQNIAQPSAIFSARFSDQPAPGALDKKDSEHPTDQTVEQNSTEVQSQPPAETPPPVVNDNDPDKKKCDKGEGNGGEGCDPGKHPEKGNNDEDSDHPGNSGHNHDKGDHGKTDDDGHGKNGDGSCHKKH